MVDAVVVSGGVVEDAESGCRRGRCIGDEDGGSEDTLVDAVMTVEEK